MTEVTPYPLKTLGFPIFELILFYEQRPLRRAFFIEPLSISVDRGEWNRYNMGEKQSVTNPYPGA